MKKTIIAAILCSSVTALIAQNRSIAFEHGSFSEIKQKALKENKLIFVDAFTTWCGPCKQMARTIFTNDTVADYYNANFVNAKIDMEKGEGIELAKQYQVNCYPNLLFIDGNGNIVHRVAGSMLAQEFIALGKTSKTPDQTFAYYKTNYEAQKNNQVFLAKYIQLQSNTCIEPTESVKHYFSLQKEEELTSATNWAMIKEHVTSMDSKEYAYLTSNKAKFDLLFGKEEVTNKIDEVHYQSLVNVIRTKPFDDKMYTNTKNKITAVNIGNTKQIIFESDLKLAERNQDWKNYTSLALANVDAYYLKDGDKLNSISWTFFESITDKEALLKAETWAKTSVELEPNYGNLDTYASLLYKNGKKKEAYTTATKAIEFAKGEGLSESDYKTTSELLEKIKALK